MAAGQFPIKPWTTRTVGPITAVEEYSTFTSSRLCVLDSSTLGYRIDYGYTNHLIVGTQSGQDFQVHGLTPSGTWHILPDLLQNPASATTAIDSGKMGRFDSTGMTKLIVKFSAAGSAATAHVTSTIRGL